MKTVHGADSIEVMKQYDLDAIEDYSANVNIFRSEVVSDLLDRFDLERMSEYPDIHYSALRTKIANRYQLSSDHVIVGNGSTELIFLIMRLPRIRRVGIVQPTFSEYARAAQSNGKVVQTLSYADDFSLDVNSIDTKRFDLIYICNPNNPTGVLNDLTELAARCERSNTILFVDETFMDFAENRSLSMLPFVQTSRNLFVLKAVTKFYSLTGVRLGYGFSDPHLISELWEEKEPWTVNCFAEQLVDVIYDKNFEDRTRTYFSEESKWMKSQLETISNIEVYPTAVNYFFIRLRTTKSSDLKNRLITNHGILIRDCSSFEGLDETYIRINIKDRNRNLKIIQALRKELDGNA